MKGIMVVIMAMATLVIVSCSKDNTKMPDYLIPDDYSFSQQDSLNAKGILSMMWQVEVEMEKGNVRGTAVSGDKLKNMYANVGGYFTDTVFRGYRADTLYRYDTVRLDSLKYSLQSLTLAAAQPLMTAVMDSIAVASGSGQTAGNGVAGVSDAGTLLGGNGIYWRQYFKTLAMGVLMAHQIQDVYLGDSLNYAVLLESRVHVWDRAYFMWGVSAGFPVTMNLQYWASYMNALDSGIARPVIATGFHANDSLFKAFVKGRAALTSNDISFAQLQGGTIAVLFERMEAGAALHTLNQARANLSSSVSKMAGSLSESLGFWRALQFNSRKKISDADYQEVLSLYGTNFYEMTSDGLDALRSKISSIYGFDSVRDNL